jgi:hypothetical protein
MDVFEFHTAMHEKDQILEHIFDPLSREKAEGTKHIVTPCQNIGTEVYKNTTQTKVLILMTLIC